MQVAPSLSLSTGRSKSVLHVVTLPNSDIGRVPLLLWLPCLVGEMPCATHTSYLLCAYLRACISCHTNLPCHSSCFFYFAAAAIPICPATPHAFPSFPLSPEPLLFCSSSHIHKNSHTHTCIFFSGTVKGCLLLMLASHAGPLNARPGHRLAC